MKKQFFDHGSIIIGFGVGILIGMLLAFKTPEPKSSLPVNISKVCDMNFSSGVYELRNDGYVYIIVVNNGNIAITQE